MRRAARSTCAIQAVVCALVALVFTQGPRTAAGADGAPSDAADVEVLGSGDERGRVVEALREPLASLGLVVRRAGASGGGAPGERAAASVSIDLRRGDAIDLVVEAGAPRRTVRRTIARDRARASPAVVAEDVAYAVRATLEALLLPAPQVPPPLAPVRDAAPPALPEPPDAASPAAAPPPMPPPRAEAPAAPPPAAPPAPRDDGLGLDVAGLVSVRGVGASSTAFGGALLLDLAIWGRRRWRPVLWVTGTLDAPVDTSTSEVFVSTTLYALRVVPALELARAGPLRVAAGVGYGVDLLHIDTGPGFVSPVTLAPSATFADPVVEAAVVVRVRLFSSVGLLLAGTVDYDTAPHHFVEFDAAGVESDVLSPWTVRPAAFLGVCVRLGGASGCAGAD